MTARNEKSLRVAEAFTSGGPVGIRTPNLLIRSQMLYPIELRVLKKTGAKIRTVGQVWFDDT